MVGGSPKNDREIFTLSELEECFNVSGLNKSPAVFDYGKLRWMNGEYIKAMSLEDFTALAEPFAGVAGTPLESKWPLIARLLHQRLETFRDIPPMLGFLQTMPEYELELYCHKKSKSDPANALESLRELRPLLAAVADWSLDALNTVVCDYAAQREIKLARVAWALRIAVSGLAVTPGGAMEIMEILGREESLQRIDRAIARLEA